MEKLPPLVVVCGQCHGEGSIPASQVGTGSDQSKTFRQKRQRKLQKKARQVATAARFCSTLEQCDRAACGGNSGNATVCSRIYGVAAFCEPAPQLVVILRSDKAACGMFDQLAAAYHHVKEVQLPSINKALGTDIADFFAVAKWAGYAAPSDGNQPISDSVNSSGDFHCENILSLVALHQSPKMSAAMKSFFKGGIEVVGEPTGLKTLFVSKFAHAMRVWNIPHLTCPNCEGIGLQQPGQNKHQQELHWRPRVAVVGAGLAGCAAALALRQRGIPAVVLERDNNFAERKQGYGLTMQQGSQALTRLGLSLDDWGVSSKSHFMFDWRGSIVGYFGRHINGNGSCAQSQCKTSTECGASRSDRAVADTRDEHGGSVAGPTPSAKRMRPASAVLADNPAVGIGRKNKFQHHNVHLPRQDLRWMLLCSLQRQYSWDNDGTAAVENSEIARGSAVEWGSSLSSVEYVDAPSPLEPGKRVKRCVLKIQNQPQPAETVEQQFDLVLGCDGIYSRVRRDLLCNNPGGHQHCRREKGLGLEYLGVMVVLGITECNHPLLDCRVFETVDGNGRVFAMPFDDHGRSMWQLSWRMSESDAMQLSQPGEAHCAALKAAAMRVCKDWHSPIPELVKSTPLAMMSGHPVFDCGEAFVTPTSSLRSKLGPCACLIGDASHPMSPFKAQGANQAVLDSVELAQALYRRVRELNGHFAPSLSSAACMQLFEECLNSRSSSGKRLREADAMFDDVLGQFEREMSDRVVSKIRTSRSAIDLLHCPAAMNYFGAPGTVVDDRTSAFAQKLRLLREQNVTASFEGDLDDKVVAAVGHGNVPSLSYSVKVEQSRAAR